MQGSWSEESLEKEKTFPQKSFQKTLTVFSLGVNEEGYNILGIGQLRERVLDETKKTRSTF